MRILVTGGCGFIGSHVAEALLAEGCEVIVIDNLLPAAHGKEPKIDDSGADVVRLDLRDESLEDVIKSLGPLDGVSHQASMVGLGSSFDDVTDYVSHNDLGTAGLLRALFRSGFDGRIALASSMVVYGEGAYECVRHGAVRPMPRARVDLAAGRFDPGCPRCAAPLIPRPIDEEDRVDPRSIYAATKLHQEHLCASFASETDAPVASLRYHNVYGPRMPKDTPYAGVASIFRSALEQESPPLVFEDGMQLRDFIHVSDIAAANVSVLLGDKPVRGAFNIATGSPRSVGDMAHALAFAIGGPDPETTGRYRTEDVRHVFASPRRAAVTFGFEARISFEAGMAAFASDPLRASANGTTELNTQANGRAGLSDPATRR